MLDLVAVILALILLAPLHEYGSRGCNPNEHCNACGEDHPIGTACTTKK